MKALKNLREKTSQNVSSPFYTFTAQFKTARHGAQPHHYCSSLFSSIRYHASPIRHGSGPNCSLPLLHHTMHYIASSFRLITSHYRCLSSRYPTLPYRSNTILFVTPPCCSNTLRILSFPFVTITLLHISPPHLTFPLLLSSHLFVSSTLRFTTLHYSSIHSYSNTLPLVSMRNHHCSYAFAGKYHYSAPSPHVSSRITAIPFLNLSHRIRSSPPQHVTFLYPTFHYHSITHLFLTLLYHYCSYAFAGKYHCSFTERILALPISAYAMPSPAGPCLDDSFRIAAQPFRAITKPHVTSRLVTIANITMITVPPR